MKPIFNRLLTTGICVGMLAATNTYADEPFGKSELQELQAELENPWCLKECETEDWKIQATNFPPGSQHLVDPNDVLFLVYGKSSNVCGAGRCVEAYILRDDNYLYVLSNGYNLPKITANDIPSIKIRREMQPNKQLASLSSLERAKYLSTNRLEIFRRETELDIYSAKKQPQGQCPQRIIVTEQNTIYEAGYYIDGYAQFNSFANSFSITSDTPSKVTWEATLKDPYKNCVAENDISRTDGEADNNTYVFVKFKQGKVYFTLDLTRLKDPNGETPEINSKDVINGNPVWQWSGTD